MIKIDISKYLENFKIRKDLNDFIDNAGRTRIEHIRIKNQTFPKYINEFWTSKQRQASSIHEISYRACFKPQLPRFFIKLLTKPNDIVYDPFSGRGTTIIEAGLLKRRVISNDVNPLSEILARPRLNIPRLNDIKKRIYEIPRDLGIKNDIDLSMFYHEKTEAEILALRQYLYERKENNEEDDIDRWIRMVATNRLTGHSNGFFSVYTLPPNQAVSQESQIRINKKRNQVPEYKDTKVRIIKKTESLLRNLTQQQKENLNRCGETAMFICKDARDTDEISDNSVQLTVTSPPFLDIVQYDKDNWLRCWFNMIDVEEISKRITMEKNLDDWLRVMADIFIELYRITKKGGWVAFEVGEVKKGTINLEEYIIPIGLDARFVCKGIIINLQKFTKTSKIWGIDNNNLGTNTNRIVLFKKV
ncbi:MAG: DNA methyltransferase [Promethearchaeota archaeon]